MPEDAEFILKNTKNCHGFYGASSMERLPTEVALTRQTRMFKQIAGKRQADQQQEQDAKSQAEGETQ